MRNKNTVGKEIGKFIILDTKKERNKIYCYCRCKKCGKEKWIRSDYIKDAKCCDSATIKFKPLIPKEKIINNIRLIEPTEKRQGTSVLWKCECFCGNIFYASISEIKRKKVRSCGCIKIRYTPENLKKAFKSFKEKNLREHTNLQMISSNKLISSNTSGCTGVTWNKSKRKWCATIEFQGKVHHLGYYSNKEDAIKARKKAEGEYFEPILRKYNRLD